MTHYNNKPKEILELEKNLKITFEKENENVFEEDLMEVKNFYTLDAETNNVNGLAILPNNNASDLTVLNNLNYLKYLSITGNEIKDLSPLKIESLEYLYLGNNQINDISFLVNARSLTHLAIWGNPIKDFMFLKTLITLRGLYCQDTNLRDLNFISDLKKLIRLYADRNKIESILPLSNLHNLEELTLDENLVEDVSPLLDLKKLKQVSLDNNLIKTVPVEIAKKHGWLCTLDHTFFLDKSTFSLVNNPLEFPPKSVLKTDVDTARNYYSTAAAYGHAPLSEGRIIVVGDGSAGKSSLIERILFGTFKDGKEQTNGINIDHWKIKHVDDRDLVFHIWDFGGQEIQHAVHKFFFTEGCLYILVLDNRKEEDPEYWLQQIESLGGSAPVLVIFNKQDDNAIEIADRKFLKQKYSNIVGFYNTSCKTNTGINELKLALQAESVKLSTVNEQFPNNWFKIKKTIEERTSGEQHYLNYENYDKICKSNNAENENIQKLLLKYFTTIGAITWFGDTYLNFLHVLSPKWITQGVYKIITSQRTAKLLGKINISDFNVLLQPINNKDYIYEETHYGYILSMMKKFDLCYTPDDKNILIPSAFGKEPKVEYKDFHGSDIRTYILQFKDYMPLALIHRFTAKKIPDVYENNYWYTGIVLKDRISNSLAMVQADKEAKRIYVRIKGDSPLGLWEHIRRELQSIISNYASIIYDELVLLDSSSESFVNYVDLISYIQAKKEIYFHPKLKKDFNVGYLLGLFQTAEQTIGKIKTGEITITDQEDRKSNKIPPILVNIINNNNPSINTNINTQINIDFDINIVTNNSNQIQGDAEYLLEELKNSNEEIKRALEKIINFSTDTRNANNSGEIQAKGWGRRLKNAIETLGKSGEQLKNIQDGKEALMSIFSGIKNLAGQFDLENITNLITNILK